MNYLYDYFPIIVFFIVYKLAGIYYATAAAMVASACQVLLHWLRHKRIDKTHIIMLVLIVVLGSLTLIFHNPLFIKWKPSVIYWLFSFILIGSLKYGSKQPAIQRMLGGKIQLPAKIWLHINWAWSIFFLLLGFVNLWVAYYYSTNTWVYFKLFGTMGATFLFAIAQAFYMYKHIEEMPNHHE